MAVKYSKQRDFGVLGRKTRKFENQMWTRKSAHGSKAKAKARASAWRKKGYKARVVYIHGFYASKTNRYQVFTHTK